MVLCFLPDKMQFNYYFFVFVSVCGDEIKLNLLANSVNPSHNSDDILLQTNGYWHCSVSWDRDKM